MDATTFLGLALALAAGIVIGLLGGLAWSRSRSERESRLALEARAVDQALVRDGLTALQAEVRSLHDQRTSWQAQLQQQVADVRAGAEQLRRETASLATALRRPQVRGRWGELHLRRAVELAGLVDRCDFDEQVTLRASPSSPATYRPDLVVNLAGGRQVVVDAKVPLDAFLDAAESDDEDETAAHLARHARQFRGHVDALAAKAYWRALPRSPEFVVLFVPGESFLSAALESDRSLIEYAADRKVVLATPTTLIALLRTVAHGWTQEALADKAAEIHRLGCELHERVAAVAGHLDKVGRALSGAVTSYNQAVGSLESRVLVTTRRFTELSVTDDELPEPRRIDVVPRAPTAADLVEDERSGVTQRPESAAHEAASSAASGVASGEPA